MRTIELSQAAPDHGPDAMPKANVLENAVLLHNTVWFARIRWVIIAILALIGTLGCLLPGIFAHLGLAPPTRWPLVLAGVLTVTNTLFCLALGRIKNGTAALSIRANIWLQIVTDMLVVTAMVHIVGSTQSFVAYVYLFHIVLACIFFPRSGSFLVTLLASSLYISCVAAETAGFDPQPGVLIDAMHTPLQSPRLSYLLAAGAIGVWFIVWYLASSLSETVHERDRELAETNERLVRADQEKNRMVLRTTHDLKAPFSGIESSIQVLRAHHWDDVPESVQCIIAKIEARSATLRERIRDILKLGELRSDTTPEPVRQPVNIAAILEAAVQEVSGKACLKKVTIQLDTTPATILGNRHQLFVLFRNLLANAVNYSYDGGQVEVSLVQGVDAHVRIVDHGIGIAADALPRIFEEYYRTKEAMRFNNRSTGLGLAIVKQVAQNQDLKVVVSSEPEKGTAFDVTIPAGRRIPHGTHKGDR